MADVAIVGATGQIGTEVVRLLHASGVLVRALVRDPVRAAEQLPPTVELVPGTMQDHRALTRLVADVPALFVVSSDPASEPAVFEAAGAAGVAHVVKSSAIGPGNAPPSDHAVAEAALTGQPLAATILRPNAFMQTLRSYLPKLVEPGTITLPAGSGATAWVDTRDIAAVATAVLNRRPADHLTVLPVTGPQALTMDDVAAVVSRGTGTDLRYEPLNTGDAATLVARLGPMGHFLAAHYAAVARGDFEKVYDTVASLTGRPARSLAALVDEHPQAWRPDPSPQTGNATSPVPGTR